MGSGEKIVGFGLHYSEDGILAKRGEEGEWMKLFRV